MGSHYPLNDVDLDFRRYAHRPFGGRDILISRIMEDLLNPSRVSPRTYLKVDHHPGSFGLVKSQDRELGLDMQVIRRLLQMECRLLQMEWPTCIPIIAPAFVPYGTPVFQLARMIWEMEYTAKPATVQQAIIELVQTHYFECDPLIRQAKKVFGYTDRDTTAPGWKHDMITHLASFQKALLLQHQHSVFSGNSQLSCNNGPQNGKLSLGSCFVALPWAEQAAVRRLNHTATVKSNNLYRQIPKRSQSLPNVECWGIESSPPRNSNRAAREIPYVAFFPRKPLSELYKLARRRSLSRSHIRAMFTEKPEWIVEDATGSKNPRPRCRYPCSNCAQYTHETKNCPSNCGYCNSNAHRARSCALKASNRCKCQPFPQFHRASKCHVQCSRRCGSPHPPGTYKHINAMLCSHRCCMCGMKGHSGTKCSLKRCPCGEQHLTQDCRWKVECGAKGCHYYLCSLHCKECGMKREKGSKNAFVGRTCQDCLKNGISTTARVPDPPS
ncbi:hypothetical protein F4782DRAFT_490636 [Xylaria castorea]|nr:hypothetical protein F4782DRAFT_490636 [Xylaria castorea]